MTRMQEITNTESLLASSDQISDEDLEAVTGGLTRPLEPDAGDMHGIGDRSDTGHDDTGDA